MRIRRLDISSRIIGTDEMNIICPLCKGVILAGDNVEIGEAYGRAGLIHRFCIKGNHDIKEK